MVVDALRDDFLDRTDNWPFVSNELKANRACRLTVTVDTPTVTMPRIKVRNIKKINLIWCVILNIDIFQSLVTGKASSFLDIILNLGSAELKGSNLVNNVQSKGVVFYGDDTWLKLLPNSFIREEGTHSFFVNDFYEVHIF
jgi:ethanolamine phosphate transferase 2 subunit G